MKVHPEAAWTIVPDILRSIEKLEANFKYTPLQQDRGLPAFIEQEDSQKLLLQTQQEH